MKAQNKEMKWPEGPKVYSTKTTLDASQLGSLRKTEFVQDLVKKKTGLCQYCIPLVVDGKHAKDRKGQCQSAVESFEVSSATHSR